MLAIPTEVADRLSKSGQVRVVFLTDVGDDHHVKEADWRADDDQFNRNDAAQDAAHAAGYEGVPEDVSLTAAAATPSTDGSRCG
jgi:hypothetical protein